MQKKEVKTEKVESKKTINLEISAEMKQKLDAVNIEKIAAKVSAKSNKSFWNLDNAIADLCTDSDKKKAAESDAEKKRIVKALRRKLRDKQSSFALSFISALKMSQKANTLEIRTKLENAYSDFNTFNKKYLKDSKNTFTNVSESNEPDKFKFLSDSYSLYHSMMQ